MNVDRTSIQRPPMPFLKANAMEPYCVKESAERTGLPVGTLYRLARLGEIPHHWQGQQLRFRACDLDEYLARPEPDRKSLATF